jgi:hypothetical protein
MILKLVHIEKRVRLRVDLRVRILLVGVESRRLMVVLEMLLHALVVDRIWVLSEG